MSLSASRSRKSAKQSSIAVSIEAAPRRISGWAAPNEAALADEELTLTLVAGSTRLGRIRRDRARPDVDTFLGYSGPPPGFRVDDFGLRPFAEVTGLADLAIVASTADGKASRQPLDASGGSDPAPLGTRSGINKSARLADLWFDSRRTLVLRFDGAAEAVKSLDAYQVAPGANPVLVQVAAQRPFGGRISTVELTLLNPFLPLLLVFSGQDGAIDAIDTIPFPSLARGGQHSAERLIVGNGGDEVGDMAAVSASLWRALLDRRDDPARCVAAIELDSAVETGLEPAVAEDSLVWLGDFLGLKIGFGKGRRRGDFLAERIARHSNATAAAGAVLRLPADAIPSISSVVERLPAVASEQNVFGGFGVVDWARHGQIWSVWQPPLAASWAGAGSEMLPSLRAPASRSAGASAAELTMRWPLAIVIGEQPTRAKMAHPFETSAEVAGPAGDPAQLAALVLFEDAEASPLPLLESLARQEGCSWSQLVVCSPAARDDRRLQQALDDLFPGVHTLLPQRGRSTRLEQIIAARELIDSDIALVVDSSTMMPDPRTVATLAAMMDEPDVATAGCLMRNAEQPQSVLAGGYCLSGANVLGTPALSFEPVDPAILRRAATYPVVANSMGAMLARRSLLDQLDSNGSSPARPEWDDVAVGLKAIEQSGLNLCTAGVSAFSKVAPHRHLLRNLSMPYRLDAQTIDRLTRSSVVVQRMR